MVIRQLVTGMLAAALALALVPCSPARAEDAGEADAAGETGWMVVSDMNLTLTQNAYSDNWAGSEVGAISWALNSNSLAERQLTSLLHSATTLKLAFGQTHAQDAETKRWRRPVKSTDLIDLESVLKLTHGWAVDPFVAGRVETQFLDESDPNNTRSLNPTVFTESFGVARTFIDEEKRGLSTRLGGAIKQHVDREVPTGEGAATKTVTTSDAGAEFVAEFRTALAEDKIGLTSRLEAYNALYNSEEDALGGTPGADDWKAVDVNWENTFTASITSYLMVNLYVQALYDKQVDAGVRLKETLSLGFTFQLP